MNFTKAYFLASLSRGIPTYIVCVYLSISFFLKFFLRHNNFLNLFWYLCECSLHESFPGLHPVGTEMSNIVFSLSLFLVRSHGTYDPAWTADRKHVAHRIAAVPWHSFAQRSSVWVRIIAISLNLTFRLINHPTSTRTSPPPLLSHPHNLTTRRRWPRTFRYPSLHRCKKRRTMLRYSERIFVRSQKEDSNFHKNFLREITYSLSRRWNWTCAILRKQ